jgi:hypothetical protein
MIRAFANWLNRRHREGGAAGDDELGRGNLFATGLVAGGALFGVIVALLQVNESVAEALGKISLEPWFTSTLGRLGQAEGFGEHAYQVAGVIAFAVMGLILLAVARERKSGK